MTPHFVTRMQFVPEKQRRKATCWICGNKALHSFYDPEGPGPVCHDCFKTTLWAEQVCHIQAVHPAEDAS